MCRNSREIGENSDFIRETGLSAALTTHWMGRSMTFYDVTDSTNLQAKRMAEEGIQQGHLVIADRQSAGRGSRGRNWDSPGGAGIFMSLVLRPQLLPQQASMVTLTVACSVADALREDYGIEAWIKWPNDIVLNRKKIAGILTEMNAESNEIHSIVAGIGINVNQESFPTELEDKATSLYAETGRRYSRAQLAAQILNRLEPEYEAYVRERNLSFLRERYNRILINRGEQVRAIGQKGEFFGVAEGINEEGGLLIRCPDGTERTVYSGEVSVRGLYRYV